MPRGWLTKVPTPILGVAALALERQAFAFGEARPDQVACTRRGFRAVENDLGNA